MSIALVVAMTRRGRVIGVDGQLPWRLPDDLRRFREITRGHAVVMGRRATQVAADRASPRHATHDMRSDNSPGGPGVRVMSLRPTRRSSEG